MEKKRIFAILAVLAALVLPALGVWIYKNWYLSRSQPIREDYSEVLPDREEISIHFETDTKTFQKNGKYTASLVLDEAAGTDLTAVSLQLLFDSELIKVDEVKTGNIFSSVNLLRNEINNEDGLINIAFGKGFEVGVGAGTVIATINFTFLGDNEEVALIHLGEESIASFTGERAAEPFFAPALFLNGSDESIDFFLEKNGNF